MYSIVVLTPCNKQTVLLTCNYSYYRQMVLTDDNEQYDSTTSTVASAEAEVKGHSIPFLAVSTQCTCTHTTYNNGLVVTL